MTQIRCIKPINGYEFNDIVDVPEEGLDFSYRVAGKLKIKNFGEGNRISFSVEAVLDSPNDKIRLQNPDSLHNYFDFELTPPVVEVEATRKPVFYVVDTADYKDYIPSGTYDNQTRINLFITNNSENFDVEFSTFYHGSLNGTPGNYSPNTWATIPRETDGSYYLVLPSNDDTTPTPQPFWARFAGNTVFEFGAYITFRTNGDDPSGETPPVDPPVTGEGGPVDNDIDWCWTVWGGFAGKDLNRPNSKPDSKTHYAEQSAISASGRSVYKNQGPFYRFDTTPQQIEVPIDVVGEPFHVNEMRYSDTDWQMSTEDMKMCNEYLIKSGFQCWNFTYYANTYALARMRQLWESLTLTDKRDIKAFYTIGQLGGNRDGYRLQNGTIDLTNDYTINLNHIVDMMGESWYKKIDGKPVIVLFNSESESATDLRNLREAYRSEYSVTDPYPFYEVFMTTNADTNHFFVYQQNMQAKTWYYQTNNRAFDTHDIQSVINDAYANFVDIGNTYTPKDIVPSWSIALDGRARAEYPGKTACVDSLTNGTNGYWQSLNRGYVDISYAYYNPPVQSNINDVVAKTTALRTAFGTRVKLVLVSTWDELSEGGKGCGMPKKRANGTIEQDTITWFQQQLNPSYVEP